jgi:ribonuclease D
VTGLQKELEVKIDEKVMQDLAKNRLFDSGKMFKKAFPKETKSNLAYLSERLWGKKLSKYEQCSGWTRRPLRLAQLHYAAFDCVLPLKICQKLSKDSNNN